MLGSEVRVDGPIGEHWLQPGSAGLRFYCLYFCKKKKKKTAVAFSIYKQ